VVSSEQGLLGIAFPPSFSAKRYFYVNYTRRPDGATVVSRFYVSTNENVADAATEQAVLLVPQPYIRHNGGSLVFGPDSLDVNQSQISVPSRSIASAL